MTGAFGNTYGYDPNGNQTVRVMSGYTHTLGYDAENRLTSVQPPAPITPTLSFTPMYFLYLPIVANGALSGRAGSFMYDADGNRVKGTINGVTVVYIAGLYEWQAGATTKYYDGGAMRRSGQTSDNGVFYMLADHLGSTSVIVSQAGMEMSREYHYPYGANRGSAFSSLTTKRFTGQYHESGLAGMEGLSYYNARWYDPQVGRFASADTVVPDPSNPHALNRLAYALNNPLRFVDPTRHDVGCPGRDASECGGGCQPPRQPPVSPPSPRPSPPPSGPLIDWRKLLSIKPGDTISVPPLPLIIRPLKRTNPSNYGLDIEISGQPKILAFSQDPWTAYYAGIATFVVDTLSFGITSMGSFTSLTALALRPLQGIK